MDRHTTDIILLHLGTNDMGVGLQTGAAAAARMRTFLNHTLDALPQAHVLLSSVIGSIATLAASVAEYNKQLPGIAADFAARGFKVDFIDMASESGIGTYCDPSNCCPWPSTLTSSGTRNSGRLAHAPRAGTWLRPAERHCGVG